MIKHAKERGANAIIGMRHNSTEIFQGVTEALAYGTTVVVEEPMEKSSQIKTVNLPIQIV